MDVRLYAVRIPDRCLETGEGLERLRPCVSEDRWARMVRFRRWSDKWRCLAAELLVRHVLRVSYGMGGEAVPWSQNEYGKPQLAGMDVSFNLSHAGNWVVAAFGSQDVGVDVEQIGEYDEAVARRFFSREDQEALFACEGEARRHRFFELWTGKESYIKAVGRGLSMPLDSFSLHVFPETGPVVYRDESGICWHLRFYALEAGYKLALCARSDRLPDEVQFVGWDQLAGVPDAAEA
jgi:4'-phosphopantetheinyl transferase